MNLAGFSVYAVWHREEDLPRRVIGQGQHIYLLHNDGAESKVWHRPGQAKAEPRRHDHGAHKHAETVSRQCVPEKVNAWLI